MSNQEKALESIVIVGGGATGWLAAAMLSTSLSRSGVQVSLLDTGDLHESGELWHGMSLLSWFPGFLFRLGVNEREFMHTTAATFRLGTQFRDWNGPGHHYFEPCRAHGASIDTVAFNHYALKSRQAGSKTCFNEYSLAAMAASNNRFSHPVNDTNSILSTLSYGYHVDADLFAEYFKNMALDSGVQHIIAPRFEVVFDPDSGFIRSLDPGDGRERKGDLFLDCSGSAALLIEGALASGFKDWSGHIPGNRLLTVYTAPDEVLPPFTSVWATEHGWRQNIPLMHRQAHRFCFNDQHTTDDQALEALTGQTSMETWSGVEFTPLYPGHRHEFWRKNCIALGAAAGETGVLSCVGIHLVYTAVMRLMDLLPSRHCDSALAAEYNRQTLLEYRNTRDFEQLHYLNSDWHNSPFWAQAATGAISESLAYKLRLFESHGQMAFNELETFDLNAWVSALIGQQRWPVDYDPILDSFDFQRLEARFDAMHQIIKQAAADMPDHREYLIKYDSG